MRTSGTRTAFAELGGDADDSLAEEDVALAGDALAVAGGEAVLELLAALVPEEDGEHLEVDDALEQVADALEEVVEVEDAGDLAGDLVEDGEGLGLAGDAGVEAGVFDGDGHAGGDELEEALVVGGEEGGVLGLDVDDADDLVFDDEGDGELGADVGVGVDVVLDVLPGTPTSGMRMDRRWRAAWPTMPWPSLMRMRSISGVWPVWKRIQSSWVRSLTRRMAKMR